MKCPCTECEGTGRQDDGGPCPECDGTGVQDIVVGYVPTGNEPPHPSRDDSKIPF